jgi:hypothetical protein
MLVTLGIIITVLLGFALLNVIGLGLSLTEKIGLSFPLGMFATTLYMLLLDALGIGFVPCALLLGGIVMLLCCVYLLWLRRVELLSEYRKTISKQDYRRLNLVWLLVVLVLMYLEYMNLSKTMYYPAFDRDSLAGFETIGYIAGQEHTLKGLSIFDSSYMPGIHGPASYITYMPYVQLSYAYVYSLGAEMSKVIPGLMYLSFLIVFYGVVVRSAGHLGGALCTLLMFLTPEMLGFSSLSMTNVMHAIFASLSIIYMVLWLCGRRSCDLLLCGILSGANIWSRTEGVVFTGTTLLILLYDAYRRGEYRGLIQTSCLSLAPLLMWTIFSKLFGIYAEGIAITHLFWDGVKFWTIWDHMWGLLSESTFYGWTFRAFGMCILLNGYYTLKRRDNVWLLLAFVMSLLFYMALLYQVDYKWDSIDAVLSYSAKRFLFCFAPLAWYYVLTSRVTLLPLRWPDDKLRL